MSIVLTQEEIKHLPTSLQRKRQEHWDSLVEGAKDNTMAMLTPEMEVYAQSLQAFAMQDMMYRHWIGEGTIRDGAWHRDKKDEEPKEDPVPLTVHDFVPQRRMSTDEHVRIACAGM